MEGYQRVCHTFEPVYDENARILILGSLPSVQSRKRGFYYGHPMNRFWKVLATVFACSVPETIEEKKEMLLAHHVALWDVIESCGIYANGKKAESLYRKYIFPKTQLPITALPSTSPANAACSLEKLVEAWDREIGKI